MNKYNKIMGNVIVTDEMYTRIMNNISTDIEKELRWKHIFPYRKFAPALVACLLLVLIVSMVPWNINKPNDNIMVPPEDNTVVVPDNNVMVVPDIVEYSTLNELSEGVEFDIKNLNGLSEEEYNIIYLSFWGDLAEIRYETLEEELTYRISKGTEDNSGIYNIYEVVQQVSIGSFKVTVKGDDNAYYLAIWNDGSMSYSISSLKGFSIEELEMLIN